MYKLPISGNNPTKRRKLMGNLNKKNIINEAEQILSECEEKYKEEGKNKRKVKELEKKCKKLRKNNIIWKTLLVMITICLVIAIYN